MGESTGRKTFTLPEDLKNMRVLVVDDNPTAREILCGALESFSFTPVAVGSGQEALDTLEKTPPETPFDLILMDWKMPGMNGLDAAERIKANPNLSRIPGVLMVTAYGHEENREQAKRIGLEGFLTKPVSLPVLFNTILGLFGKEADRGFADHLSSARDVPGLDRIRGAKILLVEDHEINRQVATELLSSEGFWVEAACNGREAVDIIQEKTAKDPEAGSWPFDAVLMDLQMPVMDGYTATAEIRKLGVEHPVSTNEAIPIIAMTAHALAGEREKCLAAGLDDYVTKPINPRDLLNALVRRIPPGERELPAAGPEFAGSELPVSLAGIDIQAGLERIGGNQEAYRKILIRFFRNNQEAVSNIQTALENCDPETAGKLAHTIKGVAGNIGADEVYHSMEAVEAALKKSDLTRVRPLLDKAAHHLHVVLDAIRPLADHADACNEPGEAGLKGDAFDREEILKRLEELAEWIEMDVTEARVRLDELKGMLGPAPEIQAIAEALEDYDSDAALEAIQRLSAIMDETMNS